MANFSLTERRREAVVILILKGRILFNDGSTELHRAFREIVKRDEKNLLLDFKEVTHIDSSGLGELVGGYVAIKKIEGEIKLLHVSEHVRNLIELTRLSTVFDIYESEDEAIESFNKN